MSNISALFPNKTAFLSCADKEGLPALAKELHELKFKMYSAGGTAKLIADKGIPVVDVADLPGGVGDMLNHRLLTLQPCVHGPLLASHSDADTSELQGKGFPASFDLVIVDFYSFEDAMTKYTAGEITLGELWEKIDVGGPAAVKSAIKGLKFPVVTKERREGLIEWMQAGCPNFEEEHFLAIKEAIDYVKEREMKHAEFIRSLSLLQFRILFPE